MSGFLSGYRVSCNLILQEALRQLDPGQLGMTISVAQCVPGDWLCQASDSRDWLGGPGRRDIAAKRSGKDERRSCL